MIEWIGLVGLCLAWLVPGHYLPWASFEQEALGASGVALIALAAIASPRPWHSRIPSPALLAVLLSVVPLAQWSAEQLVFSSDATLSSAYLLGFSLAVIAGQQLSAPAGTRFVFALFAAIIFSAIVSTGLGLAQWLQLGPFGFLEQLGPLERISANFKQANQLASLLAMGVVGVVWLYESRRLQGVVALLAIGFIGFGMVMSESRTGWLFVVWFGAGYALLRRRLRLRGPVGAAWLAIAVFLFAVVGWGELNHWLLLSDSVSIADRLQPGRRGVMWQTFLDAALRSPWVGYGWQQVPVAQLAAAHDHPPINYWSTSTHNLVLDLVIWNGIPIGMAVTGLAVWWFAKRAGACRDLDTAALLASLGVLGVHSMLELPLHYAYYLLLAGLMVGAIEARQQSESGWSVLRLPRIGYAALCLSLCALLGIVVSEYRDVEEAVRRLRLSDAGYVQPGAAPEIPDVWLLDGPREFVGMWLVNAHEGMSSAELEWMRRVSTRYPLPDTLFKYALATALNARGEQAGRALDSLCRVSTESSCYQARDKWKKATKEFPQLAGVTFPNLAEELPRRIHTPD